MPTNYVGNPAAVQSPSAAPAAGVAPTVALPNDGEPTNAASVAQDFKVLADFVAHAQASSRPDVAAAAASSSAFTAPSYSGFGGTVTPSGALHHSDGLRVVIQVQAGGAVGAATFKTSTDGGTTFGATQTTAASMTDATSGITLAFAGTLTAFGTASFRSAFTPLAQWRDAAGNGRGLVDHNGYVAGKRFDFREDWIWSNNSTPITTTANPLTVLQRWQASLTAGATLVLNEPGTAFYSGPMMTITTSATNASAVTLFTACRIVAVQPFSSIVWEGDVYIQPTGTWASLAGLSDAGVGNVQFSYGSANPNVLCKAASSGSSAPDVNTGVTVASIVGTLARLRIEIHGASSPYGSPARAFYFLNDALVGMIATNIPTVGLYIHFQLQAGAAASASSVMLSGTTLIHNRYLSAPSL